MNFIKHLFGDVVDIHELYVKYTACGMKAETQAYRAAVMTGNPGALYGEGTSGMEQGCTGLQQQLSDSHPNVPMRG